MSSDVKELEDEILKYMIDHIFMPPKLPQKHDTDSHRKDAALLGLVEQLAVDFSQKVATSAHENNVKTIWEIIPKMFKAMCSIHATEGIGREKLKRTLERMTVNDVLPVFVEAQNAGIIFRKVEGDAFTFEAFEVSLPSDLIVGTQGKIIMCFPPNPRLPFPSDALVLSTLSNILAHLSVNTMEESMPLSKKGGEAHHETRNTASPRFITEALAGIIRATPPKTDINVNKRYIEKRIDDHVLWKSAFRPWRRSSMWLVIRVALQTTLDQWEIQGPYGYKAFQAFLMASVLGRAISNDPEVFSCDLLVSMNKKLAGRLRKLGQVIEDPSFLPIRFATDTVAHAARTVEQRWKEVQELHESIIQWDPSSSMAPRNCLEFSFPHSRTFLLDLIRRHESSLDIPNHFNSDAFEANLRHSMPPVRSLSSAQLPNLAIEGTEATLQTVERWIEEHLDHWVQSSIRSEQDCLPLASMIKSYREMARVHYKGNPEMISLMHLCILELWVALDKICVRWCPLLERYSPEVAQNFADPLLLPYFSQMKRLGHVQSYLDSRHRGALKYGTRSVFRQVDSEASFHNQYFGCALATPLIELEAKIRADAAMQRAAKISELRLLNAKHAALIRNAQTQTCIPNVLKNNKRGNLVWTHPAKKCPKCRLKAEARGLRITPLECLLPDNIVKARPIVFELRCPLPFATWRDTTVMVILSLLGVDLKPHPELYLLQKYAPLKTYFAAAFGNCQISFASSAKSLAQSHYGKACSLPVTESSVLFGHKGIFNVFDGIADAVINRVASESSLRQTCTFQVDGLYTTLQSFVDDTRHSPNSVIASVTQAPLGVSPTEYTSFGLLRAGNRLQWRNIMAAIKLQTLSFSDPAVLILILQSMWQAGPVGIGDLSESIYRDAHVDLQDESFGIQVADELLRAVKSLGSNWKQVNFLAILVAVALRLHGFTPQSTVQERVHHVLDEARNLAMEWIQAIRNTSFPGQEMAINHDRKDIMDHKPQALANVAMVLRASFDIEDRNSLGVFRSTNDAVMYVYATALVSAVHTRSFDSGLRLLASRHDKVALKVQPYLVKACCQSPTILQRVVNLAWPDYSDGNEWRALSSCGDHWWKSTKEKMNFHLNITNGVFLVNGKAPDKLPTEYGNDAEYIALFKDHIFRAVYPSEIPGMQYKCQYKGHELHFGMIEHRMVVFRTRNGDIQEYISSKNLEKDLPVAVCKNHCFWYSRQDRRIQIWCLSHAWVNQDERQWSIRLEDFMSRSIGWVESRNDSTIQNLVDPESVTHRALRKTLAPLEPDPRGFVITVHNSDTAKISVHLTRQDLNFCMHQNQLACLSLPGYVVDVNLAGIGCLCGLRSILSLRHSDPRNNGRKVVVPKGSLTLFPSRHGHAEVRIDIGTSKGYFVYDIDEVVGRLVGTRTTESDLYLVKMHAFTASPLPDPLTGRTGTIEALDRLASASPISDFTLSQESRSYLDDILALTPSRTFYPTYLRVMETITWNKHLPPSTQHPAFRSLVEKILSFWREARVFTQTGDLCNGPEPIEGLEHLTCRATMRGWSHPDYLGMECRGDAKYSPRDSLCDAASQDREFLVFQAASLLQGNSSGFPVCKDLRQVILKWRKLTGVQQWGWDSVNDWLSVPKPAPIQDTWCTFYKLCRNQPSHSFKSVVCLAFQCFRGVPLDLVATLGAVMHQSQLSTNLPDCPKFALLNLDDGYTFNENAIEDTIKSYTQPWVQSDEYRIPRQLMESEESRMRRSHTMYKESLQKEYKLIVNRLRDCWLTTLDHSGAQLRLLKPASHILESTIKPLLKSWAQNMQYISHIDSVQEELLPLWIIQPFAPRCGPSHQSLQIRQEKPRNITLTTLMAERTPESVYDLKIPPPSSLIKSSHSPVKVNEIRRLLCRIRGNSPSKFQKDYISHLEASLEAYEADLSQACDDPPEDFDEELFCALQTIALKNSQAYILQIRRFLRPISIADQMMQLAGVWPIATTQALLKCLSLQTRKKLPPSWIFLLNSHATSIHEVKRMERILQFSRSGMRTLLRTEVEYTRKWKPSQYPDWLLMEIEANISIRPIQAAVAEKMLNPDGEMNSVMQLNMGEGKSSVIVPAVAASASNGRVLCRVMILRPQMKQQFQILRQTLTGLSNRRIIYLPFNRKLSLNAASIARLQEYLLQGMKDGAIWICEPEHILSLKLLGLDQAINTGARDFIGVQSWLHNNSKDILDECDEILHPRQQVVYTVGCQQSLDADSLRWEVIQKFLGQLAVHLTGENHDRYSSSFLIDTTRTGSAFPMIRIKSEEARDHLLNFIADSLQENDWPLPPYMKTLVFEFVTEIQPSTNTVELIRAYCCEENGRVMQTMLVLRGMIACDILIHSLKEKRWRVQYGLDLRRSKLAVPFRAKDSPSPRSEFGHPDVTIILTCLSYYYGGLDLEMLTYALQALLSTDSPDLLYEEWLGPHRGDVPLSLLTVKGVNLQDEELLHNQIFPLLRYNKLVIDFYLNTFIFPDHAKEFPYKMSTSGWDLAVTKNFPTTGFSGTNDGRLLLPATITQVDQPAQLHTNAKVLSYILRPENATVVCYPNFIESLGLLERIHKLPSHPTVILDVGAQIFDLSNVNFAKVWLGMYQDHPTIKAAVCFDETSNLLVLTSDGITQPFVDSPYSNRLDQCLVYLDECHTRGTDLRIPVDIQAVVTLGPKLNKDKLVQGCMRMRKLGHGHSLLFMASDEVASSIREVTGIRDGNISTEDVLFWSITEAWKQLQGNMPAWVMQGHSFVRRDAAWNVLAREASLGTAEISKIFCDPEARTLEQLYGASSEPDHTILAHQPSYSEGKIVGEIARRCQDFGVITISSAGVHEEREIELVHEKEEEREVERVPDAQPCLHALHTMVGHFINTGDTRLCQHGLGFRSAAASFKNTTLAVPTDFDKVFPNIFVTEDFWRTIHIPSMHSAGSMNSFMRSVNWVVTTAIDSNPKLMVLFSPYEVNQLLPRFRKSKRVKLHMFAPRTNLAVSSLEDLNFLTLPSTTVETPLPRPLAIQLNLFSGSLYFRDYQTYLEVCRVLRLHFGPLPPHLEKPEIINADFFVLDPTARLELGMGEYGFNVNALSFFQEMIKMRRFGRGFAPSHMGKILHGARLKESDFPDGA